LLSMKPALGEQHDDAIETWRAQRVGRRGDLLPDLFVVPLDPQVTLRPAGPWAFALRQVVRGMPAQFVTQPGQFRDSERRRSFGGPAAPWPSPMGRPARRPAEEQAPERQIAAAPRGLRCSTPLGQRQSCPSASDAPEVGRPTKMRPAPTVFGQHERARGSSPRRGRRPARRPGRRGGPCVDGDDMSPRAQRRQSASLGGLTPLQPRRPGDWGPFTFRRSAGGSRT